MTRHKRWIPSFILTVLWIVPLMALLGAGGYVLGRDLLAPKFIEDDTIKLDRPHPVRILTPDEAARLVKEPSHVWTEGVQPSDIPKLEPEKREGSSHRTRRTRRTVTPKPEPPAPTPAPAPAPPPAPEPPSGPEPLD